MKTPKPTPCPVQACPACGGTIRSNGRCANAEDGCPGAPAAPAAAPYGFVVATGEPLTEREHQALTAMDARVVSAPAVKCESAEAAAAFAATIPGAEADGVYVSVPEMDGDELALRFAEFQAAAAPTSGSGWTVGPPAERAELQFFSTRPGKGWQCAGVFAQPVDLARCPAFHRWVSVGSGAVLAAWTLPQAVYGAWIACERAQVREAQSDNPHARETAGRSLRAFEAACERYGIASADALTIFSLAGGAEAFKPAPEPAPAAPAAALPVPQPETAAPAQRCLAL
jgi:hypothetical protein